jgi:hypothetical protein
MAEIFGLVLACEQVNTGTTGIGAVTAPGEIRDGR